MQMSQGSRIGSNLSTNNLKQNLYINKENLDRYRLSITEAQLQQYWRSLTLIQMEKILTITDQKLIQHVWNYISYYIVSKNNNSIKNAYIVKQTASTKSTNEMTNNSASTIENDALMWCYDCKIFKNSPLYSKEEKQHISAFIIRYIDTSKLRKNEKQNNSAYMGLSRDSKFLYQFVNPNVFLDKKTIFKCKASYLLKVFSLFKGAFLEPIRGDITILTEDLYFKFIYNWTHFSHSWQVQPMVLHLFKGLLILIQNQILLSFFFSLTQKQKQIRRFQKPVLVFSKPKLKSTFTMIQQGLGDVEWATLKIPAYKIKYRIVEQQQGYHCFRVKEQQSDAFDIYMHNKLNANELSNEDKSIIKAFDTKRSQWSILQNYSY